MTHPTQRERIVPLWVPVATLFAVVPGDGVTSIPMASGAVGLACYAWRAGV